VIKHLRNISIAPYTNYKIGGVARETHFPTNASELLETLKTLERSGTPYYLLGGGSNVLVGDRYWDGAVVLTIGMNWYKSLKTRLVCGAGLETSKVAEIALENGKTGLEFLYLLPGTIGGALAMNARYDMKSIADSLIRFTAVHPEKGSKRFKHNDVDFAYKHNSIVREGWTITDLTLSWKSGNFAMIQKRMAAIEKKRADDRHFDFPSCGCIFKNDHEHNIQAGKLLDELGFKGFKAGGAQVSEHHANFIINTGSATAHDVLTIIEHIERTVREKRGIELEREVKLKGKF